MHTNIHALVYQDLYPYMVSSNSWKLRCIHVYMFNMNIFFCGMYTSL